MPMLVRVSNKHTGEQEWLRLAQAEYLAMDDGGEWGKQRKKPDHQDRHPWAHRWQKDIPQNVVELPHDHQQFFIQCAEPLRVHDATQCSVRQPNQAAEPPSQMSF
jgi:hypothetical protein